jgi:hypothetical protein
MIDHHRSKIVAGPNEETCCPSARQPLQANLTKRDVLELYEAYTARPHHWEAWSGIFKAGASRRGR